MAPRLPLRSSSYQIRQMRCAIEIVFTVEIQRETNDRCVVIVEDEQWFRPGHQPVYTNVKFTTFDQQRSRDVSAKKDEMSIGDVERRDVTLASGSRAFSIDTECDFPRSL